MSRALVSPVARTIALGLASLLAACGGGSGESEGNAAPLAAIVPFDPGPPSVAELSGIVLDATPSEDPDGDPLTFAWQQIAGPAALVTGGAATATLSVTAPKVTDSATVTFRVTVSDGRGGTDTEDVTITVNERPVVVFIAPAVEANTLEVFRRHASDAAPVKLHPDAALGATAHTPLISPDRRYVAYVADREGDGGADLYVARLDGQGEQRLTTGALPGSLAFNPAWAPDGSRIAFRGTLEAADKAELFVARPDFVGGRTKLSGEAVGDGVIDFHWAPDSGAIAFRGFMESNDAARLYVVPAAGGARVEVSGAIVAGGGVGGFAWSPDSARIALLGDLIADNRFELFVANPINAVPRAQVSGAAPAGSAVWEFRWSPDSATLAFFGPLEDVDGDGTLDSELYTAPGDGGGARTQLSGPTLGDASAIDVQWLEWSPDSARVVFWGARSATPNAFELFSAPRGVAGTRVSVSGAMQPLGVVSPFFAWHPDGQRIAFVGDVEVNDRVDLYVAQADGGGARVRAFGGMEGGNAWSVADWLEPVVWSLAGDTVLLRSEDVFDDGERHLIAANADGSGGVAMSGLIADGGDTDLYQWMPDGESIVFSGDVETNGVYELFTTFGGDRAKLSGPLPPGGFLSEFVIASGTPAAAAPLRDQKLLEKARKLLSAKRR